LVDIDNPLKSKGKSFLSISDSQVDSAISKMSVDDKIDLIFQENFKYLIIKQQTNLNSISDSSFILDYLQFKTKSNDSLNYRFVNLKFDKIDLQNLEDSVFSAFYLNRIGYLKQEFRNNNNFLGLAIDFHLIDNLTKKAVSSKYIKNLNSLIKTDLDILFIDSVTTSTNIPIQVTGLLLVNLNNYMPKDDKEFLNLFQSNPDVFLVNIEKHKLFKSKLKALVSNKTISDADLNTKIRKIVKAKLWMNLAKPSSQSEDNKLYTNELYESLLSEKSIALLNNPDSILPIKYINQKKFTVVWIGNTKKAEFIKYFNYYVPSAYIELLPGKKDWKSKTANQAKYSFCIYVLDTLLSDTSDIRQFKSIVESMNAGSSVIINFKNHNNLAYIPSGIAAIQVQSTNPNDYKFAAQAVFGGISINAQLPLNVNEYYKFGLGKTTKQTRLKYSIPEEVGVDTEKLKEIDNIVNSSISGGAFPGCQVFVIKKGQVIYDKCFGYHTYSHNEPVRPEDLYDLASVTKVSATTIATMKMITDRKMSLNDGLGRFFKDTKIDYTRIKPDTVINIDTFYRASIMDWKAFLKGRDTTNINDSSFVVVDTVIYKLTPRLNIFKVPIIDLLKHQSGIAPALPIFRYMYYKAYFVKQMKEKLNALHGRTGPLFDYRSFELPSNFPENTSLVDSLKNRISKGFKQQYDEYFSTKYVKDSSDIRLTDNLFLRNKYFDTIWRDTKQLPVYNRKVFIYSDINMILLQMAIDSLNRMDMDTYMKKTIYGPLGLRNISYLPLKHYSKNQIVPTEQEKVFRYGYLHGYVHDPSAALLGGLAGNAGLFASAHDLGVLFQMILNNGTYGGIRYISPAVIRQFTTRYDEIQRGLGFDMPNHKAKVGSKAPQSTYGHSGYTGTCVWVDPENELVYVFLTNRNHPNANNWRMVNQNVRERVHDAVYNAMMDKKKDNTKKTQVNI
jgi:CubicO group peptidase (beta-lactamase class C family)